MTLKSIPLRPGINLEGTNYSNEGGWYNCDKVRFRSGYPEKIGGWVRLSQYTFLGIGRSMWNWIDLDGTNYLGIGTSLKYYIEKGGYYFDITPIRLITSPMANNPFSTVFSTLNGGIDATQTSILLTSGATFPGFSGVILIDSEQIYYDTKATNTLLGIIRGYNGTTAVSHLTGAAVGGSTIVVTDTSNGTVLRDFVTFSGSTAVNGFTAGQLNIEQEVTNIIDTDHYTFAIPGVFATSAVVGGGAAVVAEYQINTGLDIYIQGVGWSTGPWGRGTWGSDFATSSTVNNSQQLRLWSNDNFGQDLLIAPRGGGIYYWKDSTGVTVRAVSLAGLATAAGYAGTFVPNATFQVMASDVERFVITFGSNPYIPATPASLFDPLLVRWSDQANPYQWVPAITNQSGEYHLSRGSYIMAARIVRTEILIWTDSSLYSMQYLGPPYVWGFNTLEDNISIMSPNSMILASSVMYWMGTDKFYMYSGRVETMPCAVKQYVFEDINLDQAHQVFAGTNKGFNEIWWFYCSRNSTVIDKYVIYNHLDRVWYIGTMGRTFWLDSGIRSSPMGISYDNRVLYHEIGPDDVSGQQPVAISAFVQSADFDIGDGHIFGFMWRMLPDINFNGSNINNPYVTMTTIPRQNAGSPYGTADAPIVTSADDFTLQRVYIVQEFTGQVYTRLRGRQMSFKISSDALGVAFQLGLMRIDVREDGRR